MTIQKKLLASLLGATVLCAINTSANARGKGIEDISLIPSLAAPSITDIQKEVPGKPDSLVSKFLNKVNGDPELEKTNLRAKKRLDQSVQLLQNQQSAIAELEASLEEANNSTKSANNLLKTASKENKKLVSTNKTLEEKVANLTQELGHVYASLGLTYEANHTFATHFEPQLNKAFDDIAKKSSKINSRGELPFVQEDHYDSTDEALESNQFAKELGNFSISHKKKPYKVVKAYDPTNDDGSESDSAS